MKIHKIKCDREYFDLIYLGKKLFELRKNDKNYKINDVLHLHPTVKGVNEEFVMAKITYILKEYEDVIKPGWVIMSIAPYEKRYCF